MAIVSTFKEWGLTSVRRIHALHYNYVSKKRASRALAQIENEKGKLKPALRKQGFEYAKEELGWQGYAPWLNVYMAVQGCFKDGWIPDNYYHLKLIPKIQGDYGKISFLKPLNNILFSVPSDLDIAYFINGQWLDSRYRLIQKNDLSDLVFEKYDQVVFKADHSYQGKGVFLQKKKGFDFDKLESKGNGTLQGYIDQHRFFKEFRSHAVATLRMTTSISNKGIPVLNSTYLRLGRTNDHYVQSKSHIRVPVDLSSGELYEQGYMVDWSTVDQHPDSKVAFSKKYIPQYKACIDFVCNLHLKMPMVKCIGWDIIVNAREEPVLIEWNGYGNDISFSEATQGPCFKNLKSQIG